MTQYTYLTFPQKTEIVAVTQLTNYKELQKGVFCFVTKDSLQFNVNKDLYKIIDDSDSRVLLISDKLKYYVDGIGTAAFNYTLNSSTQVKIWQSTGINLDDNKELYGFLGVGVYDSSEAAEIGNGNYYLIQISGQVIMGINPGTRQWDVYTDFQVASH